jgi:hypothetical protein
MLGVHPELVLLWEKGSLLPDHPHVGALSDLAECESFMKSWRLAGSGVLLGDLELASAGLSDDLRQLLDARIQRLVE